MTPMPTERCGHDGHTFGTCRFSPILGKSLADADSRWGRRWGVVMPKAD